MYSTKIFTEVRSIWDPNSNLISCSMKENSKKKLLFILGFPNGEQKPQTKLKKNVIKIKFITFELKQKPRLKLIKIKYKKNP